MVVDPRASDLIEALKIDEENFILSNLILKNHRSLKAIFEYFGLWNDLLEFAKDPAVGIEMLGPEPQKPTEEMLSKLTDREKAHAMSDYETMVRIYNDRKKAMEMHVPFADYVMIDNYMKKYNKVFHTTPAVKGLRFKSFTKDTEKQEQGGLAALFKRGGQNPS